MTADHDYYVDFPGRCMKLPWLEFARHEDVQSRIPLNRAAG